MERQRLVTICCSLGFQALPDHRTLVTLEPVTRFAVTTPSGCPVPTSSCREVDWVMALFVLAWQWNRENLRLRETHDRLPSFYKAHIMREFDPAHGSAMCGRDCFTRHHPLWIDDGADVCQTCLKAVALELDLPYAGRREKWSYSDRPSTPGKSWWVDRFEREVEVDTYQAINEICGGRPG